eukprot:CAMPEP_0184121004 /NCGR_PEP_ID=MMETSP0974-20121125/22751_1 /TAXON_ID=483370 /ORGANISM="non described non described, Strain CCMP2097" /LENGTH=63 /DNA_ID=CAMNT_0026424203 /DNA_START=123 /DNA_END=315 /DNA_ORIENTATION=+
MAAVPLAAQAAMVAEGRRCKSFCVFSRFRPVLPARASGPRKLAAHADVAVRRTPARPAFPAAD